MCRVVCWAAPGQKGAGVGGPTFASGAALTVWKDFPSPTVEAGPHPRDGKGRTLSIERMPVSNDEVDMAVDQNSPPCARTPRLRCERNPTGLDEISCKIEQYSHISFVKY